MPTGRTDGLAAASPLAKTDVVENPNIPTSGASSQPDNSGYLFRWHRGVFAALTYFREIRQLSAHAKALLCWREAGAEGSPGPVEFAHP